MFPRTYDGGLAVLQVRPLLPEPGQEDGGEAKGEAHRQVGHEADQGDQVLWRKKIKSFNSNTFNINI